MIKGISLYKRIYQKLFFLFVLLLTHVTWIYALNMDKGENPAINSVSTNIKQINEEYTSEAVPEENEISYSILRQAFYDGRYSYVLEQGQKKQKTNYELKCLIARSARAVFLQYSAGELGVGTQQTENKSIKLNYYATLCTESYENAVRSAPDQYSRSALANEWLTVCELSMYNNADSEYLRSQFPTEPHFNSEVSRMKVKSQAKRFKDSLIKAMGTGRQGKMFGVETREKVADLLTKEFEQYALIGIPDDIFLNVCEDLFFFFDEGLPMNLMKGVQDLSELRPLLKWYLWEAIIEPVPDHNERKEIDRQVNYLEELVDDNIESYNLNPKYMPFVNQYVSKWGANYEKLKDNRFVPYFKRAILRYRFKKICESFVENLQKYKDKFKERIDWLEVGPGEPTEEEFIEVYNMTGKDLIVFINSHYVKYDRPTRKFLPDEIFIRDSGTLNEYYVYTFVPKKSRPVSSIRSK